MLLIIQPVQHKEIQVKFTKQTLSIKFPFKQNIHLRAMTPQTDRCTNFFRQGLKMECLDELAIEIWSERANLRTTFSH